jgi:hypothetical protein
VKFFVALAFSTSVPISKSESVGATVGYVLIFAIMIMLKGKAFD